MAASKPGGLLVHRSSSSSDRVFFLQQLRDQLDGQWIYPVHRLDRAASGIMVFAFSSEGARRLQQTLQAASARKEYLTLARGTTPEHWEVDRPLTDQAKQRKPARTSFERVFAACIGRGLDCSMLRAQLHTGRRHQIRRHLARAGHFIFGDTTYGKGGINNFLRESYGLPRLFLHAIRLDLLHPTSGELLRIDDPLPADLRAFLERLTDIPAERYAKL
ncbi:MAG: pseudouridylate synthase [Deltaproteobacteria bacterium]|nr:pseudouridylate synthase [Deltaproteobacteria bacterium]